MMSDNTRHFRILSIRVLRFHQEEPEEPIPAGADFAVNIKFTLEGNKDDNVIRIIFDVDIQKSDEATSLPFISIVTAIVFKFKEDDAFTINEKGKVIITAAVLNPLVSLAYSTTRGILFAKAGSSNLASLILPPMSITELKNQFLSSEPSD